MKDINRKFYTLCLVIISAIFVSLSALAAETDFEVLKGKAERFYKHREWASALAMYKLMLMQRPGDALTYSHAITVNGVLDNTDAQMQLIEDTQQNGIALDTLFGVVKKEAFALGKPSVYERLLYSVKERQPWLKRGIDIKLLQYYDSRNNAPRMVSLSDTLLVAFPHDVPTLRIKARGYMLLGDFANAVQTYEDILKIEPDDFDANVNLGVYYYKEVERKHLPRDSKEAKTALNCLEKACSMKSTPYINELISGLKTD